MSFDIITTTLSADVADNGTFTVAFPAGRSAGNYTSTFRHKMGALQSIYTAPTDFTLAFTTLITVTWKGNTTLPAGTEVNLQVDRLGTDDGEVYDAVLPAKVSDGRVVRIDLGAPATADADGYCASQDLTALGVFSVSVTAAAAIAAAALAGTADKPRNVVAAWTGTAVLTVTGTDEYGEVVKESSASGTSLAGKKAFKTITGISSSANITGLTVGTGDVLGLPVFLPTVGMVFREIEDAAVATAGTVVAGVTSVATATTGDVRGTYDPNSAANGTKNFSLLAFIPDASEMGVAQYAG